METKGKNMHEDMHILTMKLQGFMAILIRSQACISHLYQSELAHHFSFKYEANIYRNHLS